MSPALQPLPFVSVQRTLEFLPTADVELLLSISMDLRQEVAVFLATRYVAGLRRMWGLDSDEDIVRPGAIPEGEAWIAVASRYLLDHRVVPRQLMSVDSATGLPELLRCMTDVPGAIDARVAISDGDSYSQWMADVVGARFGARCCCAEVRSPSSGARVTFVRCDETSFYHAMNRGHRNCMTLQATRGAAPAVVDSDRVDISLTRLWLPCMMGGLPTALSRLPKIVSVVVGSLTVHGGNVTLAGCFASRMDHLASIDLSGCTSLTAIGPNFVSNTPSLRSVKLPSTVVKLQTYFCWRSGVESIDLSHCTALSAVGDMFAVGCDSLTNIDVSGCSLAVVPRGFAFKTPNLTSVKLPSTVTRIDSGSFSQCGLSALDLSCCPRLTALGPGFLSSCRNLTAIDLVGCTSLKTVASDFGCRSPKLSSVSLPKNLTSIGDSFCLLSGLQSLDLSRCIALTRIDGGFVYQCEQLKSLDLSGCTALKAVPEGFPTFNGNMNLKMVTLPATLRRKSQG